MKGNAIEVRGLGRTFGAFKAVDDVSFDVKEGEIFGYLGANGAGKSTTIRMLCGLLAPSHGEARVAGHSIATAPEKVKASIGYMSQKFSLYLDLTAADNLAFFGGAYGLRGKARDARAKEVLELIGLSDREDETTSSLPGGFRQRLALGCAMLHQPRILFLDEPTAGVDPVARRDFWDLIRKLSREGTTIFVTTHYMDEAEYCDRVGLMVDGKLVALDTPRALEREFVPGRILEVHGDKLDPAAVRGKPGVLAVEPFGLGLHVRHERSLDEAKIVEWLTAAGATDLAVGEIEANLEDVFLAVVGRKS